MVYYDAEGQEQFQAAHIVILANNGIGTPRLLLNSANARFPRGLANSSDQVGRNRVPSLCLDHRAFNEELDGERGPDNSYWSHEFYETDLARGFVRGFCYEFSRGEGTAATAIEGVSVRPHSVGRRAP